MEYIYLGKIVNTHGIKGEIRIICDAENKELAFRVGNKLLIGEHKNEMEILTYRKHKNYDMVTLKGINNISDAKIYKNCKVYILKDVFKDVILDVDLIDTQCYYNDKIIGKVKEVINNNGYKIFDINGLLIPYNMDFIESINTDKIVFKNIGGFIHE